MKTPRDLRSEFEKTGQLVSVDADIHYRCGARQRYDGRVYTQEYVSWLERKIINYLATEKTEKEIPFLSVNDERGV